ncbi:c-type cytochrome biogenesis protein CcmI [Alphaproteobacteria bacterium 46_93_T64]|nr:c-type cytochrome biogenesis protein CcmI [Alphaproteobacteria bacterium 46_93_T64]
MIWFVLCAITLVAAILLLLPFLNKRAVTISRQEQGISVYKQQLAELDADVARGVVNEADVEPVRVEIQRRILRVGEQEDRVRGALKGAQPKLALMLLVLVFGSTFTLYKYLGSPQLPSQPLAARDIEKEKRDFAGQDFETLVERLAEKLSEQPDNVDGWVLLARTLSRMRRFDEAAATYIKATILDPTDVDLYVGAGENFYYAAKGTMSDAALEAFTKAADLEPEHPGARYYLAEYDAQKGDNIKALEAWLALYRDSDPDAPFMQILRERIGEVAGIVGRDVSAILETKQLAESTNAGPSRADREAAAEMSAADRQDMINSMVARLEERMQSDPEFDGLMKLGKAFSVQRHYEKSADAYARAAKMQEADPLPLILQALALVQNVGAGSPPPAEAITLYRKVLTLDDTVAEAHWYIGLAEMDAGRRDVALTHWKKMQSLVPEGAPLYANVTRAIKALSQPAQN